MTGKNIHQRLHDVMQAVDYIQKERKQGMRYTIVSHDAVTAKVRPELVKAGVVYYPVAMTRSQNGNRTEIDLTVRFANIDEPSDFIDVVAAGYGVDEQDKGPGKAISYAVKYCLLKALGLETGDDPDETQDDRATHRPADTTSRPATTKAPEKAAVPATSAAKYELLDANEKVVDTFHDPMDWCNALRTDLKKPEAKVAALWENNRGVARNIERAHPALVWRIQGKDYHPVAVLENTVEKLAPGIAA